ncbi:hypothetical protein [Nocardia sp. NPDC057353]|uniref:hypothetical protein n=1 Tax=Nocardia sp. NPDC057353 TaxID=3346104 RepID=UPI00363D62FE
MIRNGTRLASQVCETQVIVVKSTAALESLTCGGAPLVPLGAEQAGAVLDPDFAEGTVLGKRYAHESGAELLVTRAGAGSLAVAGIPLGLKQAAQLPSSD